MENEVQKKRILSGIQPSGDLTLGSYLGAIKNWAALADEYDCYYMLADMHTITVRQVPAELRRHTLTQVAAYIASGLDPEKNVLFVQSHVPAHAQLGWVLDCYTMFGELSRMTQFKDKSAKHPDNVNIGLLSYPVLMAADILIFKANLIPVGRDQIQHIEMCRDIAARFNMLYGNGKEILPLPEALIDEEVAVLPGLDGRKMSKSYDNVIPLFEGGEKALKEAIMKVVTDSKLPGEPKDPDSTSLTQLYEAFATHEEREAFRKALREGLSWGEAKEIVFNTINGEIGPMREKYEMYMREPEVVEKILIEGVERIRPMARELVAQVREAVGLRAFRPLENKAKKVKTRKGKCVVKQYREKDGLFYFKLVDASGNLLVTAGGLASGKETGALVKQFKAQGMAALTGVFNELAESVSEQQVQEALRELAEE